MKSSATKKQQYISLSANIFLILLCIGILSSMFFLRPDDAVFPGSESYFNLRLANSFNFYDDLSCGGRSSAYYLGLPLLLQSFPALAYFLPALCGLLSLFLLGAILQKLNLNMLWVKVSQGVFVLSPPFIYLFTTLNQHFLPLFLALLAFCLLLKGKPWMLYVSIVLTVILPAFSLVIAVAYLAILTLYVFYYEKSMKSILVLTLCLTAAFALIYLVFLIIIAGLPELALYSFDKPGLYSSNLIAEFGSYYGLSLFGLMVAVLGVVSLWERKYNNLFIFFSVLTLIFLTLIWSEFVYVLNIFLCIFAAKALLHLFYRRWESKTLQQFVLLILFCGLLFSALAQLDKLREAAPTEAILDGLNFMSSLEPGVVFSHYSRGHWIAYTGHANVMDENFMFAPDVNMRWVDSNGMFGYRDKASVLKVIEKYEINYIWIDNEMKDNLWDTDEDGLLFVLKYDTSTFKKVFENDEVQIWKVE